MERIGVEYCRSPPFEHCGEAFAGLLVASEAGPYQEGGDPFVVDRPRKVALLDYQFGGGVGMGMLAQQLYIPCPAAHRGFGGQQRCARHGARNHGQQAAAIFMRIGRWRTQLWGRGKLHASIRDIDANRNEATRAHRRHRGHQPMRQLPSAECERQVVMGQGPQYGSTVTFDGTGHIDSDFITVACGNILEQVGKLPLDGARQSVSEQAIDGDRVPVHGIARHIPGIMIARDLRGLGLRSERGDDFDTQPPAAERLRDDIPVTAIVSRAAQHAHRTTGRDARDPLCSAAPGPLHQFPAVGARSHGRLFGSTHLFHG